MAAGATYEPIATTTLGSAQSTITFSSIPQTYTDLVLVTFARTTDAADGADLKAIYNSDTSSIYSFTQLYGTGSSAASNRGTDLNYMKMSLVAGSSTAAGTFATGIIHIQNYSNTTTYKTNLVRRDEAGQYTVAVVNLWRSTAAITSMTLNPQDGNFDTGSTFTLYGILSA